MRKLCFVGCVMVCGGGWFLYGGVYENWICGIWYGGKVVGLCVVCVGCGGVFVGF